MINEGTKRKVRISEEKWNKKERKKERKKGK